MSTQYCKAHFALALAMVALLPRILERAAQAQTTPAVGTSSGAVPSATSSGVTSPPTNPFTSDWLIGNSVSDASSPQYQEVNDAITRFRNQDISGARELLSRVREKNPKIPPVEVMMARLWAAAGQFNNVHAELEKAVMAYPNDPDAYLYFSELALAEHRVTDAESDLLQAKSLIEKISESSKRKRNFDIRLNSGLAAVAENRNQWETALPYLKSWMDLDPDNALVHARMGRTLFELGKPKEAYNEYEAAQKIDSKSINPYIALAGLYEQAKDHDNATKSISYAVQKNPKDPVVQLQAARWGMATNQLNEAQKYADAALKIDPKSLDAKILLGEIARITGDLTTAETLLEQAVAQAPLNIEASNQLALVLIEQNDKDKKDRAQQIAELDLRATTQGDRANPEIAATYAWVLYKLGDTAKAEEILNKVLATGSISPDTAFYVGKILQDRGKTDVAINVLEQALTSPAPFAQRQATAELLSQLKKEKEQKDKDKDKSGATVPSGGSK
ncbi:MAG TPA: tetratricopeptide repeat protein [Pirellulales bacterium]|nr:tetratricopeptide repeat protein [Pirellulales bacterium]